MTQPSSSPYRRLRRPVAASVGIALLATGTAGCLGNGHGTTKVGGGPPGQNSASPARIVPAGSPTPQQSDRPNIVTIVTDDMRTDDLRWMPNVRHLIAQQGLDYLNSFASFPLCAPARSSLLTGQYAHNTGVLSVRPPDNYEVFNDRATIGTAMNRAGYNTLFLGKYMNGYGDGTSVVTGKNSFRYVPPGWTDWYGAVNRPRHSGFKSGGTYSYYHVLFNHNGQIDDHHKGTYQTVAEGRIARRLVVRYHRSAKPFFLYFTPIAPHVGSPQESDDPKELVHSGIHTARRLKTAARPKRVRGIFDSRITRASGLPKNGGPSQRDTSGLPRPMRWLAPIGAGEKVAMLSATRQRAEALHVLDGQIGKLVHTLKATGEYSNTVLMFTSDNGFFLGEHRMRQGKIWAHEPSLRVPFLVSGPGVPRGHRYDPVNSTDIAATILDIGRAVPPHPLDGRSLVPSFRADRGWLAPLVVEGFENARVMRRAAALHPVSFSNRMTGTGIRTARWKYVRYVDGDAELYDLAHDPSELHNLYGRPKYAHVQAQLARVWAQYRNCAGTACQRVMPPSLQAGPRKLARLTHMQERRLRARYGVPAL
jgi:N-acetylglucosamine-6-sulfatase